MAPELGDLKRVDAGFSTGLGVFAARTVVGEGRVEIEMETPRGTRGEVRVPTLGCRGRVVLRSGDGECEDVVVEVEEGEKGGVTVEGVEGGKWNATFECEK